MLLLQTIDIAYSPTITMQYLYFTIISSTLVKSTQLNSKFSINIFPITEVFFLYVINKIIKFYIFWYLRN